MWWMRVGRRVGGLLWLVLALAPGWAQEGEEPPRLPPVSAPERRPEAETRTIADRDAELETIVVSEPEKSDVVRITLSLSYPKTAVASRFEGPGAFVVELDRTTPADELPLDLTVAKGPIAALKLTAVGSKTRLVVQLNTPTRCRAWAVPSRHEVIIDCALVDDEPDPAADGAEGLEPGQQKLTIEFVDTDIRVIVAALVAQTGANLMLLPGVSGTWSLSLKEVTLETALDALWEAWSLLWVKLPGNIYLVGTAAELGERASDVELALPEGWQATEAWAVLSAEYPTLRLRQELRDLPAEGPLQIYGLLATTGEARRWLAGLPPRSETDGTPTPPDFRREETISYTARVLGATALADQLKAQFPDLAITPDEVAGRVELKGNRRDLMGARRLLAQLDQEPVKEAEEALFFPGLEPERLRELASTSGVEATVVQAGLDGTLAFVRGTEPKVATLRNLVEQLQSWQERKLNSESQADQQTIRRTYDVRRLTAAEVDHLVAASGLPVATAWDDQQLSLTGRTDRVATLLALLSQADTDRVHRIYKVRYARVQDLVRLVRAAVPELETIDWQWQTRPGEAEWLEPVSSAVTPPAPAVGEAATPARPALGPVAAAPAAPLPEPQRVGPGPRLIVSGPEIAVERALALLAELDAPPAEVELEAVIAQLSPALAAELSAGLAARRGFRLGSPALASSDLADLVAKIEADEGSKLLARPALRTVEGGVARLLVGQRIRFQPAGGDEAPEPPVERAGIVLEVAPTVPGDGTILCRIHPEVSELAGGAAAGTPIATREADATVRIADGGTIIIAGLGEPMAATPQTLVILLAARVLPPL